MSFVGSTALLRLLDRLFCGELRSVTTSRASVVRLLGIRFTGAETQGAFLFKGGLPLFRRWIGAMTWSIDGGNTLSVICYITRMIRYIDEY